MSATKEAQLLKDLFKTGVIVIYRGEYPNGELLEVYPVEKEGVVNFTPAPPLNVNDWLESRGFPKLLKKLEA